MNPSLPVTPARMCGALLIVATVTGVLLAVQGSRPPAHVLAAGLDNSHGTLVRYEPLDFCVMPTATERQEARQARAAAAGLAGVPLVNSPARTIKDPYPSFAAVAVDTVRNEVVFTDESLFQVLVYDRLENAAGPAATSRPRRVLAGKRTNIEFQSGVYVDGQSGDIYAVNNDTRDTTLVFRSGAEGNTEPYRSIKTPHGTFGIAVAEKQGEALLTVQHDAAIVTYRKDAVQKDLPTRLLQGERTKLADPHGIAYDPDDDVVFVANFGSRSSNPAPGADDGRKPNWPFERRTAVPGSGTIGPPSITVYRRDASGDQPPLRVIEGPETELNWPTGVAFDPTRRELYVTNDAAHSVLVFDAMATGNVKPKRVLKGPRTRLANPTGVALDLKNGELWIANFGGHSATVYTLGASGDTAPLRTIRNAPEGAASLMIGNPGAVTYDTKREEILVPN